MKAYVLINAVVGKALDVAEKVRKVPGVSRADAITGKYDVIASSGPGISPSSGH